MKQHFGTRKKIIQSLVYSLYLFLLTRRYWIVIKFFTRIYAEMIRCIVMGTFKIVKAELKFIWNFLGSLGGKYLVNFKRMLRAYKEYFDTLGKIFRVRTRQSVKDRTFMQKMRVVGEVLFLML